MTDFNTIKLKHHWKPISGCPGRYTLSDGVVSLTIPELVGHNIEVKEMTSTSASDPIKYCTFEGGGLISYVKQTGHLHTLCNQEGMERKMKMLKGNT
ncbi:MAG: hypothetical protein JXR97_06765 [Planctomycetes bacterium]|nr:hypothetical protein [Planctomycetota bacterium]